MKIRNKISSLLIGCIVFSFAGVGVAGAAGDAVKGEILDYAPTYIRISIGNHEGCPDLSECVSHNYKGSIAGENATVTLGKGILIYADEVLDNDLHDTGLPSEDLDFEFSTPFYKGFVLKLYPDDVAGPEDFLTLNLQVDESEEFVLEIPYKIIEADSNSVLATALQIDDKYSEFQDYSDLIRIQPLNLWMVEENVSSMMRNKFEIIRRMLGLERYTREKLLSGEIENLTYTELQKLWSSVLAGDVQFDEADVMIFTIRFNRLKKLLEREKTSLPRLIGGLNRTMSNIYAGKFISDGY
jgi:hypothetical protein